MNKLFGLVLVPFGLAGAIWMPCAGSQAETQTPPASHQFDLGNKAVVRVARADVAARLVEFRGAETPENAMALFEGVLVCEGLEAHVERRFESFGVHNLPDSSSNSQAHFLIGSESAGLPVVRVERGVEADYWRLEAVLEGSSDPWFEYELEALYARLVQRARKIAGTSRHG